jgi:hypothetical protein
VEVVDPGVRFEANPAPTPALTGDALGHWGFHLVRSLADRWGVEERYRGKSVWFEIDL